MTSDVWVSTFGVSLIGFSSAFGVSLIGFSSAFGVPVVFGVSFAGFWTVFGASFLSASAFSVILASSLLSVTGFIDLITFTLSWGFSTTNACLESLEMNSFCFLVIGTWRWLFSAGFLALLIAAVCSGLIGSCLGFTPALPDCGFALWLVGAVLTCSLLFPLDLGALALTSLAKTFSLLIGSL